MRTLHAFGGIPGGAFQPISSFDGASGSPFTRKRTRTSLAFDGLLMMSNVKRESSV